ncbi:hypothetical protein UC34_13715 [Pandoraea vervacti]|uniref:Lipoprotein n=1 Tax=Pandoraea vervacti TaxID=656178 RepID=A0ABM5SYY7_9BURK|nr:hypothetical protein [Pandoraea vervacti]AJP57752.1 hypothetical protein UC34_13715 [Pandoraea vervacti]
MKTRRRLLIASLCATATALIGTTAQAARPAVPIVPHDNIAIISGSGKTPSLDDVRGAIARGAAVHDWTVSLVKPGEMVASINVRNKHYASVMIKYTETAYSVTYRDSTNLEYQLSGTNAAPTRRDDLNSALPPNTPMIHPNYNRWVETLIHDINSEIRRL